MVTLKSESTISPPEWDLTSAHNIVYHNYNVEKLPATEDLPERYKYDVDVYTLAEYQQYINTQQYARQDDLEAAIVELADIVAGG